MAFLRGFFDNLRSSRIEPEPTKVLEVKPDEYALCNILAREDSIVLYQYLTEDSSSFDIVLHKDVTRSPHVAFSILRSNNQDHAEISFIQLKDKLPLLLECVPDLVTKDLVQEVANLVRSNPTWTLAHLAAHLGLVDCFKSAKVACQINSIAEDTFVTPLHVAIRAQKLTSVQALMGLDARMDLPDHNGDTVFHAAAATTKDIIKTLASRPIPPSIINQVNNDGYTPLQLACLSDKPECVRELLKEGADVNSGSVNLVDGNRSTCMGRENVDQNVNNFQIEDMKHGGTPLHWAKTTQCLEQMIDLGCDLDAKNFMGFTALHVMVARGRLSCVISLLSHGACVNAIGAEGDTPLHVAVKVAAPTSENWSLFLEQGDVSLIQALIVFGADVNAANNKGESPRHLASVSKMAKKDLILYTLHAVGAQRCHVNQGCSDGCSPEGAFDGIAPEKPNFFKAPRLYDDLLGASIVKDSLSRKKASDSLGSPKQRSRLLCLDGGGIRGLVIIQMLVALELIVGCPILDCFDWVAGTSTGGVLALLLACGKTPKRCLQLYFSLKDKVFVGSRPHEADILEKFLQRELGENTVMTDIKKLKIMITGVLADRHPAALHFFRNYDSPKKILGVPENNESEFPPCTPPEDQLVWRAARASGAAPTYFKPFGRFLDGGLISNNPTLDALTEICEFNEALKATGQEDKIQPLELVISMGTGKIPIIPVTIIDILHVGSGLLGAAKMAFGAKALGQLIVDQATQANGRLVDRAQAWCHMIRVPYFRLNAPISEDIPLNETDNKLLVKILWETMVYMRGRRVELEELAQLIHP